MFREMRRAKRALPAEAAEQLLQDSRRGVLAVNGANGYPYAIPINYLYDRREQKIFFHGARAGHKLDAIRACGLPEDVRGERLTLEDLARLSDALKAE